MTRADEDSGGGGLELATLLRGLGHEIEHAAELLRRYERAVLARKTLPDPNSGVRNGAARELQLVDLVIQLLEDIGPLGAALANHVPAGTTVPAALVDRLRLDQLRVVLGGSFKREAPHSGGDIDVF